MPRTVTAEQKQSAKDSTLHANESSFRKLLTDARLPVDQLVFSRRKAASHAGDELVVALSCPNGHRLELTMDEVQDDLKNTFFNDPSIVPHLCKYCAYPAEEAGPRKSTVYHRLALLSASHPAVKYVSAFDPSGKSFERYQCGLSHADRADHTVSTPHAPFEVRYDKLVAGSKTLPRPFCYECGVAAGMLPETKNKTLAMMVGRMKIIHHNLVTKADLFIPNEPTVSIVQPAEGTSDPDTVISTTRTIMSFQCGDPYHEPAVRTADSYFNARKGGYCKRCLAKARIKSTSEIMRTDVTRVVRCSIL